MQDHIFNGFRSEMEKRAGLASSFIKGGLKLLGKNKMNTALVGMGVHEATKKATSALPKFSRVPGT